MRTHRKLSGLSQKDIAFLLGCQCGAVVSRLECRVRQPSLRTVLAYQVLFGVSADELLPFAYKEVEQLIAKRACVLSRTLARSHNSRTVAHKLEFLRKIFQQSVTMRKNHHENRQ